MLGIAMMLWSVAIWPFIIRSQLFLNHHQLPAGIAVIKTIGIKVKINWEIKKTERGYEFHVRFFDKSRQRESSMSAMRQLRSKISPLVLSVPYLKENLMGYFSGMYAIATIRLGLGDAAATAIVCGALGGIIGCFPRIDANVIPDFRNEMFSADIKCIASFRLGKLLLSAVLILCASLTQKMRQKSGGVMHGSSASHQQRDANGT